MIEAERLCFTYPGQSEKALSGLNLKVSPGGFVLISGPTGCGKSTLGMALCGAIPHLIPGRLSGSLAVCGRSPARRLVRETAKDIGFLLQNVEFMTFTDKVDEEIAFGLENFGIAPKDMDSIISHSLNLVKAGYLKNRLLTSLSAGERQKAMLAALLALNQQVLVLDEPLAFLDAQAQTRLLELLRDIAKTGRTVVVFEHRRDIVRKVADSEIYITCGCRGEAPEAAPDFAPIEKGRAGETVLACENISFGWSKGQKSLLKGISFSVKAGQSLVLLGDNGTGKTTLLGMAMGLVRNYEGSIRICGMDPARSTPAQIAGRAALIFQQPDHQLYLATVEDEVGSMAADRDSVRRELAAMNLADLAGRHPRSLSTGQKRRVTLAAACARKPDILLLDELSVGQDDKSLSLVLARLSRFVREGGAILAATHDPRVAKALAHQKILLEKPE